MSDLIERLEEATQWDDSPSSLIHEAIARIAELAAENERLKRAIADANADRDRWYESSFRATTLASTGAVKIKPLEWSPVEEWKECSRERAPAFGGEYQIVMLDPGEGELPSLYFEIGLGAFMFRFEQDQDPMGLPGETSPKKFPSVNAAKAAAQADFERRILSAIDTHQRATNTVDAHETVNVSDKPEGQQEPVAWASVKDHLPEVGSKFVLLYDDGSGASLYFRHDSGYIDADGDECDALDENRMWAYLPAGFEFWCEGASEPITLPKWRGPSGSHPSEQAVTEALFEALKWFIDDIDGSHTKMVDFDENVAKARSALKAAMEAGG